MKKRWLRYWYTILHETLDVDRRQHARNKLRALGWRPGQEVK